MRTGIVTWCLLDSLLTALRFYQVVKDRLDLLDIVRWAGYWSVGTGWR